MNIRIYNIGKVIGPHPVPGAEWFANVPSLEIPGMETVMFGSLKDATTYCAAHYAKHKDYIDTHIERRIDKMREAELHGS
jgi:hypothetical protein